MRATVLSEEGAGVLVFGGRLFCPSLKEGVRWLDMMEVAAVEFLAMEGMDDMVEEVSRFLL